MSKPIDNATITIPAGTANNPGVVHSYHAGILFYVLSATTPFQMQFDNDTPFTAQGGFIFGNSDDAVPYSRITFYNPTAFPITLTYYSGRKGVGFIGTNQFKVASTYEWGNFGLKASGNYNGQAITINGAGAYQGTILLTTAPITIIGTNNGHQRKGIVFSNWGSAANSWFSVNDQNGCVCFPVPNGAAIYKESDSIYQIAMISGTQSVSICETYYSN